MENKTKIKGLLIIIMTILLATYVASLELESGNRLQVFLMNDSSGAPMIGETCDMSIYNYTHTNYILNASMTDEGTGIYYFAINTTTGTSDTPYHARTVCTFGGSGLWYSWAEFYIVSNRINPLVQAVESDMGLNFTIQDERNDAIDGNITQIDGSLSSLSSDMGVNFTQTNDTITGYGDQQWASAMTTDQNDTIHHTLDNLTQINLSIINHGDASWSSGISLTQNATLYSINANVSALNATITGYGDQQWAAGAALSAGQNETLYNTYLNITSSTYGLSAIKTYLVDTIYAYLTSMVSDLSANFTIMNSRFDAVDTNITEIDTGITVLKSRHNASDGNLTEIDGAFAGIHTGIETNKTYLNDSLTERFDKVDGEMIILKSRHNATDGNLTYVNSSLTARLDLVDTSFAGLHTAQQGNTTYINNSLDGRFNLIDPELVVLKSRFNATDGNITEVDTALVGLSVDIETNKTYLNESLDARFSTLDTGMTTLKSRFNATDSNLSGLSLTVLKSRFNATDGNLTEIDSLLASLSSDLEENKTYLNESLDGRFNAISSDIIILKNRFNSTDGNITEIDSAFAGVHNGIENNKTYLNNSLNIRFNAIVSDFTTLKSRFNATDGNLTYVNSSITDRSSKIDTTLASLSSDLGANKTYLNASITDRASKIDSNINNLFGDLSANFTLVMNTSILNYNYIFNTWSAVVNGSMFSNVWSYATRTLSAVDYDVFGNWSVFNRRANPNATVFYTYDASYYLQNVTYNYTDDDVKRFEKFNYDNNSYLDNVSIESIR